MEEQREAAAGAGSAADSTDCQISERWVDRTVVVSVADIKANDVQLNLFELTLQRKELVGCIFGNANPRRDIPRLLRLYQEGQLKLDELITNTYPLEDINVGYQAMRDGTNIRGMVIYDHSGNGHTH